MKHFRLWAVCLVLTLLAVCAVSAQVPANAPDPAAPTLTGPVTHIRIVGLKNISADAVQAKLTLKVGDVYTPEAAQKDAAAIQSLGYFNGHVAQAATPASPNGIDLTYTVRENPVVESIKFTANTPNGQPSVPAAELTAQMKTQVSQVLNTNILVSDLDTLFNHTNANAGYVIKQGYLMDVGSDINIDPKTGLLTIPLVEAYISSIKVTGNSRVKTADILAQIHIKVGDLYNTSLLENDEAAVYDTGKFKPAGSFNANIAGPGKVDIAIQVVEQPAATGTLDEKQGKVIPFLYDPLTVPFPVVQVSVNGRAPLSFVLDTGTTAPLLLAPWAAKELGLSPNSRVEKANNFTFSRVPIKSIVLQGSSHDNDSSVDAHEALMTDWGVLNLAVPRPHIAGIIGIRAIVSATSRFDFAAKTLTIWTTPHPPLHVFGGTTLPLHYDGSVSLVHAILGGNSFAELVFDTGSDSTQIPLSAINALKPAALATTGFYARIDAVYVCPELQLPGIRLGSLQVPNVVVGTLPPSTQPSLGMNILTGYRLTFDGPNAQLILEPALQGGRYNLGWAGISLKQSGDGWEIDTFKKGSPAQSVGLEVGDKIVSVNGVSVAGTSQSFCKRFLGGLVGHQVRVIVQRGASQRVSVSWAAIDDFHAPSTVLDGLPMQKASGGPWIISQVIQGYAGDKAGLQAGDQITKMDGEATATMSLDRFAELAKKPTVQVEVERPGVTQPFTVRLTATKQP